MKTHLSLAAIVVVVLALSGVATARLPQESFEGDVLMSAVAKARIGRANRINADISHLEQDVALQKKLRAMESEFLNQIHHDTAIDEATRAALNQEQSAEHMHPQQHRQQQQQQVHQEETSLIETSAGEGMESEDMDDAAFEREEHRRHQAFERRRHERLRRERLREEREEEEEDEEREHMRAHATEEVEVVHRTSHRAKVTCKTALRSCKENAGCVGLACENNQGFKDCTARALIEHC